VSVRRVLFEDRHGDGEGPWTVSVDGEVVIDEVGAEDMDVSAGQLKPLWDSLGVEVTFKWKE
jgi:hypothetical protein